MEAVRRIADALNKFAKERGWSAADYQIYIRVNEEWRRIRVTFVARDFGTKSTTEMWEMVHDFLEKELASGPDLGFSIGLSTRDFDQVAQGGIYSIPEGYTELADYLVPGPTS
jgi:hypothetical protein